MLIYLRLKNSRLDFVLEIQEQTKHTTMQISKHTDWVESVVAAAAYTVLVCLDVIIIRWSEARRNRFSIYRLGRCFFSPFNNLLKL